MRTSAFAQASWCGKCLGWRGRWLGPLLGEGFRSFEVRESETGLLSQALGEKNVKD